MTEDLAYRVELDSRPFERALGDLELRAERLGSALSGAMRRAAVEGRDLDQVLRGLALRMSDIALDAGLRPLQNALSGAVSNFAESVAGRVVPFAKGGVVSTPSYFPMGGDIGLAGEAGAEAILPLARGADGRLGVAAGAGQGAGAPIVFNVTTPDAQSFLKSEAQLSAMLARAVGRGTRGL
ncbi:tail protein [Rhizobium albus]|nr:tail protein [Rhizobium albus]